MFDLGSWGEFIVILIATLVLIGPKEIPQVLRTLGKCIAKIRHLTTEFRKIIEHHIEEAEIEDYKLNSQKGFEEDIRKSLKKINKSPKKIKKTSKGVVK